MAKVMIVTTEKKKDRFMLGYTYLLRNLGHSMHMLFESRHYRIENPDLEDHVYKK